MKNQTKNPYRSFSTEPIKAPKKPSGETVRADKTVGGDLRVKGGK